ncbi:MAG: hypothetical protein Q8N44_01395 [Rubrivivax sp.]|nr:hypothetical protein [Rubrivivax sp.]
MFLVFRVEAAEQNTMKKAALVSGVISAMLGGLWLLQGLGLAHVRPILCFADCAPIQGASLTWAIVGFLMVTVGVIAIFFSVKRRAAATTQFR